jgi:hypothetical protein
VGPPRVCAGPTGSSAKQAGPWGRHAYAPALPAAAPYGRLLPQKSGRFRQQSGSAVDTNPRVSCSDNARPFQKQAESLSFFPQQTEEFPCPVM